MIVFQGIQQILAHCLALIQQIGLWFSNLPIIDIVSDVLPPDIVGVLGVVVGLLLTIGTIGLIKKLSFLLG